MIVKYENEFNALFEDGLNEFYYTFIGARTVYDIFTLSQSNDVNCRMV